MIDRFEGKIIAEKYRVDSLIRESQSGDLYFARHIMMDKPVTLKILAPALAIDERYVKRFTDEAKFASAVSHPNNLNVIDFGTDSNGIEYTVFDGIDGETLKDAIRRDGQFTVDRSLRIAKQIAAAASAGHAKSLVHSDFEPQNIVLNKDGENDLVKVYGLGSVIDPKHANPQYLSPEQSEKPPVTDPRSNIYSLGVILYHMLAGEPPYSGDTPEEILVKQTNELPSPLSAFRHDTPDDLEPMIISAMSRDPDHRYQTMDAFAEDLTLVSMGVTTPVKAAAAAAAASPIQKRSLWQTATIVLAGILILGVALIYSTATKQTDPTTQMVADAGSLPVQPINPATGAQEDNLSKLPAMTEAEIMAAQANTRTGPVDTLPGDDGYNAWGRGGAPPPGAPLPNAIPQGGQNVTIDPNGCSAFMPCDNVIQLVPIPANSNSAPKSSPTPKPGATNANLANTAVVKPTPKPLATPPLAAAASPTPPKSKPTTTKPATNKPEEDEKQQ